MKTINFINPLPPQQHKELITWHRVSTISLILLVSTVTLFELQQWQTFTALRAEKNQIRAHLAAFNTLMERKQKLKTEEQELKSKVEQLNQHTSHNPAEYLSTLSVPQHLQVDSVSVNTSGIEINAICPTVQQAMHNVQRLSQTPYFKSLKLVALQPNQQGIKSGMRITLKGIIASKQKA